MNCEILFRGKRVDNGQWVYGWYCKYAFRACIIPLEEAENGCIEYVQVDPATVSQYINLTDENGVKIFKDDIVKTKKYGKIIPKNNEMGCINVNDFDVFQVVYEPCMFRLIRGNRGFNLVDDRYSKFEVIGNIHDNPELLEVRNGTSH